MSRYYFKLLGSGIQFTITNQHKHFKLGKFAMEIFSKQPHQKSYGSTKYLNYSSKDKQHKKQVKKENHSK